MANPAPLKAHWRKYLLLTSLAVGVLVADQVSKYQIVCHLTQSPFSQRPDDSCWTRFWTIDHPRATDRVSLLGEVLQFTYQENPGAAWSLFAGANARWRTPFFIVVSILASIFIVYYYHRTPLANRWLRASLGLVLGGALGNLADRFRSGYVVDFIRMDFGVWPANPWPTYNVADIGITLGVIVILLDGLILQPRAAAKVDQAA